MLDHSFTPRTGVSQLQTFYQVGAAVAGEFQVWIKPRNIGMVSIKLIGAGVVGGSGFTGASLSARGGGGGGGSGAITDLLIPASLLPDVLYVLVGRGTNGNRSYVSLAPDAALPAASLIGVSGAAGPGAGGNGSGTAGGIAGTAGTVAATTTAMGHGLGLFVSRAGQSGAVGGAQTGAIGGAVTFGGSGIPITGGAGGGGTNTTDVNFAGGAITGSGLFPTLNGGLAAGGAGQNGFFLSGNPMWAASGGSGGGTNGAAGSGGVGGIGNYGSGGGGGGGGVTGGAGGNGGDGIVFFNCW